MKYLKSLFVLIPFVIALPGSVYIGSYHVADLEPVSVTQDDKEIASERLIQDWQDQLDATGRLHIPFDPAAETVTVVRKNGIITACRYVVQHSLHVTPDFDYEISSDPRVEIVFNGNEGESFICYDDKVTNSPWTGRLYIHDLDVKAASADWMSCIRTTGFKMAFNKPIFERCTFFASGYAFDFHNVDYTVVPVFRDIMTGGGGALRFTSTGGGQNGFHSTSQMEITSWMHNGNNRVGPAFDLRGTAGLVMTNVIDEQKATLHPKLKEAGWTGPLSLRISSPYFPVYITNYWNEWWGDVGKMAPGCWASEIRSDSRYADGKKEIVVLDNFMCGGNGTAEQPHLRIVGGGDGKQHCLYVIMRHIYKPRVERIGVWGKAVVKIEESIVGGNTVTDRRQELEDAGFVTGDLYTEPGIFPPTINKDVNLNQKENHIELLDRLYYEASPYYEAVIDKPQPEPDPTPPGPADGSGTATGDR